MRVIEYLFPALRRRREAREKRLKELSDSYYDSRVKYYEKMDEIRKSIERLREIERKYALRKRYLEYLRTRAKFHRASVRVR